MTTARGKREKPSIALIGLRGSGKSAVGRELATLLGGQCVDIDELVVEAAGRSITAVFDQEGEPGFRRRERNAVAQVVAAAPAVISVGGGALLDENNVRTLKQVATLVWLTAPVEVLRQRVASDRTTADSRPPLTERAGLVELKQLLAERSPIYEHAADLTVDTEHRTPREVARAIAAALKRDVPE